MKTIKRLFLAASLALVMSLGMGGLATAAPIDGAKQSVCTGINTQVGGNCGDTSGVQRAVSAALRILSIIVGIAAVIMVVVAGLKYITSGGDSSNVASAKNTLIYAIVGLVIAGLAQAIVRFVLGKTS